jgi:hypothetical protein
MNAFRGQVLDQIIVRPFLPVKKLETVQEESFRLQMVASIDSAVT